MHGHQITGFKNYGPSRCDFKFNHNVTDQELDGK